MNAGHAFWRDRPTLVTGASGLVGGWLVKRLQALGAESCVSCGTGSLDRSWSGARMVDDVTVVRGDIRDADRSNAAGRI